jgi:peptidoglycan/LPS O-acetylase OafA/YrhL
LYLVLCVLSLAFFYLPFSTHPWLFEGKIPWYAYLTFGQNFWMAKYDAMSSRQIDATWSLAIEEQFYLTLPLVIRLVREKFLPYVLAAGIVAAPLIRIALWIYFGPERGNVATYVLAPCRMDALLLGVIAAWLTRNQWDEVIARKDLFVGAAIILGAGFAAMIRFHIEPGSLAMASFGYTWIALFYLSLLFLAVTGGWVARVFRLKLLGYLGVVAYGLYLFHQPVLGLVYALRGRTNAHIESRADIAVTAIAGLIVVAIARLSWRYFEQPMVKFGHRYKYELSQSA